MAGYCDCHLSNAVQRIYENQPPARLRALVREAKAVEAADPFVDPAGFERHMRFEETYLRPHLSPADRATMDSHHAVLRSPKFSHMPDARRFFDAHARWEQSTFARLGRAT